MDIVIERKASEMLRRRSIATQPYLSTSCMQTHKWWVAYFPVVLTGTDWLFPNLSRESAASRLSQDKGPSTSAAINLPPSRWEKNGRLGKEGSDQIDQVAASIVGGTGTGRP